VLEQQSLAAILISSQAPLAFSERVIRQFRAVLPKPILTQPLATAILESTTNAVAPGNHSAHGSTQDVGSLAGKQVLVVEDNSVNQRVIQAMLSKLDVSHELATNGVEALESVERNAFDVVLMDCQMPHMDGFTVTRAIRERERAAGRRRLPIIALTANALRGDDRRCFEAGMDDYMTKPFTLDALRSKIESWCALSSQSDVA
jgi:CheY-like chemotaxis protein